MFSKDQRKEIFDRTNGHCHFCGDPLIFESYGKLDQEQGAWAIDHIIQRGRGGSKDVSNCLPACTTCNRYRWHRSGKEVRDLLLYGLVARDEVRKGTRIGEAIAKLKEKRLLVNQSRRRKMGK